MVAFRKSAVSDKPLPHNPEAERAVLGAILLDNAAMPLALRVTAANDFFLPANRLIFAAMFDIHDAGTPIDTITLMEKLSSAGSLEAAGGVAYLSSLPDGLPRSSSVEHHAKIVAEKAQQRAMMHRTQFLMEMLEAGAVDQQKVQAITRELDMDARGVRHAGLTTTNMRELLTMQLPPEQCVIDPLLPESGRGQVFSVRGAGKTFVMLEMAICVAAGIEDCLVWRVPKARPVLYVDGEMQKRELQERTRHLMGMHNGRLEGATLPEFISRDMQTMMSPRINTSQGRRAIEEHLKPDSLQILDNLSALSPSADEKETEDWAGIQEWLLDLSTHGISTIFVHHAGWNAEHGRGSSKREDLLSFVLRLKRPVDYRAEDGLRVHAELTKLRGKPAEKKWGQPFELSLVGDDWLIKPLWEMVEKQVVKMLFDGMKAGEIAQDMGLSRYQVYRIQKKVKDNPGTAHEI